MIGFAISDLCQWPQNAAYGICAHYLWPSILLAPIMLQGNNNAGMRDMRNKIEPFKKKLCSVVGMLRDAQGTDHPDTDYIFKSLP